MLDFGHSMYSRVTSLNSDNSSGNSDIGWITFILHSNKKGRHSLIHVIKEDLQGEKNYFRPTKLRFTFMKKKNTIKDGGSITLYTAYTV